MTIALHSGPADPAQAIKAALADGDLPRALAAFEAAGGALFPFLNGYQSLGALLDAFPADLWQTEESVLGALVFYLVKQGRAGRARAYLQAHEIVFEPTARFELYALLVEIHLGGPVRPDQLAGWARLERRLPVSDPLLEGLYHNCMLVMLVRLGRLREAREAGHRAISCFREARHDYLEHFIHLHLADLGVVEGRLRAARRSLAAARQCLARSCVVYGNARDLVEIIQLAIDYETGQMDHIPGRAAALRASLLSGDSWSELFVQLARISVLSIFFSAGRARALAEVEAFQADHARRHGGGSPALDLLEVLICQLDWHVSEAERGLSALSSEPLQSAIGAVLRSQIRAAPGQSGADAGGLPGPRGALLAQLDKASRATGPDRRSAVERALWIAVDEGQIAPLLEHRDLFAGLGTRLASGRFARGNKPLVRMTGRILRAIDKSYVIPSDLAAKGVTVRQYRVMSALQGGATNKQVARQLGITEATVKYHLTGLYRLLGISRRSELIEHNEIILSTMNS